MSFQLKLDAKNDKAERLVKSVATFASKANASFSVCIALCNVGSRQPVLEKKFDEWTLRKIYPVCLKLVFFFDEKAASQSRSQPS